ncbi:MAG: SDR family oxidoreductase [Phycisphaeraceae bacterium]|nr:SDR family oxidoreductase [Phycisphaeraceae bacterium]
MTSHPMKGRVAVVTGATAGIGEALVRRLVGDGCFVVVNARRADRLDDLRRELGDEDVRCVAGDASDESVIERMLDTARDALGTPGQEADLVVINAGRGVAGSVIGSDTAVWEEMVRTNYLGAARLLRAAALRMQHEAKGEPPLTRARDIVVLGSVVGRHVSPFSSMYGSTKFAVHSLAEGARRELAGTGIRVTLIEPGFVKTEFQGVAGYDQAWFEEVMAKVGPPLSPDDVARTIMFSISQPAGVHVSDLVLRPTRQEYP